MFCTIVFFPPFPSLPWTMHWHASFHRADHEQAISEPSSLFLVFLKNIGQCLQLDCFQAILSGNQKQESSRGSHVSAFPYLRTQKNHTPLAAFSKITTQVGLLDCPSGRVTSCVFPTQLREQKLALQLRAHYLVFENYPRRLEPLYKIADFWLRSPFEAIFLASKRLSFLGTLVDD